ncbi:Nitrogen permease regulator 2 [Linnemannia schmuckeri]|uniref:Nitrogen permease regulator 2 n=1 Tax=Linnemannia schmuckeri TaxID=64567 RepID=A0A9P5S270_9FUNG|nr:Nitrogen permease regulator 2 [Linnemannia schmuckeri]
MGFPRLLSIFYCTFHPTQGPKVLYEVPEGSILSKTSPLVDFDSISEYLIPKVELCAKLVTISTPTCKVIGYPINLEHKKFQRNALMFNLAFVFDKDAEISSYEPVVRKMARVLKALEKESEFLSRQTRLAMMDNGALASLNSTSSISGFSGATTALAATATSASSTTTSSQQPTANGQVPLETITEGASSLSINGANKFDSANGQTQGSATTTASASPSIPNTLGAPIDPTTNDSSAATLPPVSPEGQFTAVSGTGFTSGSITYAAIVSSPPSMSGNSIGSVLTAPPSSSPFPPSRSTTSSGATSNGSTAVAKTKPQTAPSLMDLLQADGSGMQNLIEQLIEDLNSYCECQIPIDTANTINLKLFPTYPNPAPVYDYQVPISTVNLEALTDVNWDMTMQRITGYINGVNSVKRIAEYADVETGLARMCMEHLLYYGCIIMVDLFQFKNIYAVKMEMMRLTEDVALQYECVAYVTLPDMHAPSFAKIFSLYCSLQYGVVLQDWIEQNQIADYNIDVRRFISFGVIKGFLYRVHKYPILDYYDPLTPGSAASSAPSSAKLHAPQPVNGEAAPNSVIVSAPSLATAALTPSTATATAPTGGVPSRPGTPSAIAANQKKMYGDTLAPTDQHTYPQQQQAQQHQQMSSNDSGSGVVIPLALRKRLNGQHHYDELCTHFGCSVRDLDRLLATDSRVKFIYR